MLRKFNNGVALIQVLLISAILSVLAIQLNKSAQLNTKLTIDFDAKLQAEVALRDSESFLYFSLLTDRSSLPHQLPKFNYYNEEISLSDGINLRVQDTAGLVNAHFPKLSVIRKIGDYYNLPSNWADSMTDQLNDWQDPDDKNRPYGAESVNYQNRGYLAANVKLSLAYQIQYLAAVNQDIALKIAPLFSTFGYSHFNPYNAPAQLLNILYGHSVTERIISLRQSGAIDRTIFSTLTNVNEGEGISFITSNFLMIHLTSRVGNAVAQKTEVVELIPRFKNQELPISRLYTHTN